MEQKVVVVHGMQCRPARAGEVWNIWTPDGPMVPITASVGDLHLAIGEIHKTHEMHARRMNEMLSALHERIVELEQQQPPAPPGQVVPIRPVEDPKP